jgi:hypothetical protein
LSKVKEQRQGIGARLLPPAPPLIGLERPSCPSRTLGSRTHSHPAQGPIFLCVGPASDPYSGGLAAPVPEPGFPALGASSAAFTLPQGCGGVCGHLKSQSRFPGVGHRAFRGGCPPSARVPQTTLPTPLREVGTSHCKSNHPGRRGGDELAPGPSPWEPDMSASALVRAPGVGAMRFMDQS